MVKFRGNLNKQDLNQLDQAQIVENKPIYHGISTQAAEKKKEKTKKSFSVHKFLLAFTLLLLLCGVGLGVYGGKFSMGTVAVDELTALHVVMNINSTPQEILTNASTIEELLNEQRILLDETDYLGQELDQPLYDGMVVWLRLSVPISILVDGETFSLESQPITVRDALEKVGVELGPNDTVSMPMLQYIYEATEITVNRIRIETVTVEEPIEQSEVQQERTYLAPGSSTVVSEGRKGARKCVYEVTYENGVEISRKELSSEVIREPESRVVGVGPSTTAVQAAVDAEGNPVLHTAETEDGASFYYKEQYEIETTAYTWTGNTTYTGTWPKRGTIAVDPSVIPLGTKVYVVGYGFATAEDTGGAIKGNIIDLYMDTEQECINWGRRDVVIYILAD
ncbi:MAG: 3D domain-containing protein [Bacillota bacterium]|nr:3D domain-containing protein [Bacillota bacterium]